MSPLGKTDRSPISRRTDLFELEAVDVPPYTVSALIYDHMMKEVDYKAWSKYILLLMKLAGPRFRLSRMRGKRICELGCGTGNLSAIFSNLGLDVTGVDSSGHMLDVARRKSARSRRAPPHYIKHNMATYRTQNPYEAAICAYDSINYISARTELRDFFSNVFANLKPGGVFVFDASLESNSLGEASQFKQRGKFKGMFYQRQSSYDPFSKVHTTYVRVAISGKVSQEAHREKVYTMTMLRKLFNEAGFIERYAAGNFTMTEADDTSERVHFVLVRPEDD